MAWSIYLELNQQLPKVYVPTEEEDDVKVSRCVCGESSELLAPWTTSPCVCAHLI